MSRDEFTEWLNGPCKHNSYISRWKCVYCIWDRNSEQLHRIHMLELELSKAREQERERCVQVCKGVAAEYHPDRDEAAAEAALVCAHRISKGEQ